MDTIVWNFRAALRTLSQAPMFLVVVALILGLGIGATTALYSAVDMVLLRPSAYAAPDELVHVERRSGSADDLAVPWPFDHYRQLRERPGPFSEVAAFGAQEVTLSTNDLPTRVRAEFITDNYLSLLGLAPASGRALRTADAAAAPEALLAHGFWRDHFGGAPDVVGRTVRINGLDVPVVGVLPAGFRGESGGVDVWLPVEAAPQVTGDASLMQPFFMWLDVIGRLRPGVELEAAESHLVAVDEAMVEAGLYPMRLGDGPLAVVPVHGSRIDPALRSALLVVFASAVAVLMIACLNIASLLLARSRAREREIAVRRALGATSWKLAQQFMAEGVVLAVLGGVVGVAMAMWLLDLLRAMQPVASPGFWSGYARALSFHDLTLDTRVLRFALLVTLGSGFAFGLLPALRSGLADLTGALKSRGGGQDRRRIFSARSVLVVGEVALALVLLAGAGLLTRSFLVTHATDFGFSADRVVTMRLQPPAGQYPMERVPGFTEDLRQRLRAIAGMSEVGISNVLPLTSAGGTTDFVPEGHTGEELPLPRWGAVTPEYFTALGIRLRGGRLLSERDVEGAPRVAVINATLARQLFSGLDPVGRRAEMEVAFRSGDPMVEIVGVVEDVQYGELGAEIEPRVYLAYAQRPVRSFYITARSATGMAVAPVMRGHVAALDPELAISNLMPMRERVSNAASRTRFGAVLVSMFAVLAGILATLGIYGVMASAVGARKREIAIRTALGGRRAEVMRSVLREGVGLMSAGIGLGLIGALASTRVLRAHLFGIEPTDPLTFVLVVCALGTTAMVAAYIPALRATRVDPMKTLRED